MKKLYHTHGLGRSVYKFQISISVEEQFLPKNGLSQLLTALILSKYAGMNPSLGTSVFAPCVSAAVVVLPRVAGTVLVTTYLQLTLA